MKRLLAAALITLLATALPMTALAHGHGSKHKTYKLCTVRTCKKTGNHKHNGKTYRPHHQNDGHRYHKNHH